MAAAMIAAIDIDVAQAGCPRLAEGDFLRVGHHGQPPKGYLKSTVDDPYAV
jgi:hypothetical protein